MSESRLRVVFLGEPSSTFSLLHHAVLEANPRVKVLLWLASPVSRSLMPSGRAPLLSWTHFHRRLRTRAALEWAAVRLVRRPAMRLVAKAELVTHSRIHTDTTLQQRLIELKPDLIISAGFRQIVPSSLLAIPSMGAFNCHPSPLPRYAGSNPWFWMLRNGEQAGAVTIHRMVEEVDAGGIVAQRALAIGPTEYHQSLYNRSSVASASLLSECIGQWIARTATERPQDLAQRTVYAAPRAADFQIDWSWTCQQVANLVRAASPAPGAWAILEDKRVVVHEAAVMPEMAMTAGAVTRVRGSIMVGCRVGAVRIKVAL